METTYNRSYSLASLFEAGLVRIDVEDILDWVHALNESVQKQLEELDRRYMELYE